MEAIENKGTEAPSEESILVEAARSGDIGAFESLVRRYDRNVFRIAQHITQNREDAEDVVQDAFLKAYQNLGQFQGQSKFYTWLVRIAVNEALMRLRQDRNPRRIQPHLRTVERRGPGPGAAAGARPAARRHLRRTGVGLH